MTTKLIILAILAAIITAFRYPAGSFVLVMTAVVLLREI
jgi:hypothetical protein